MGEIILAKSAGFCFGVNKAVDEVYRLVDKNDKKVFTFGPIIHNEAVVDELSSKGVSIIESEAEFNKIGNNTLVIRSHGVSKDVYDKAISSGADIVDATCPFVKKIHNIVSEQSKIGKHVVIIGDPDHPEIIGIKGWGNKNTVVIRDFADFVSLHFNHNQKLTIVAQTTYNYHKFKECVEKIKQLGYDITCFDTVCNATQERQSEAKEIAARVDVMIVIGGSHSSNTRKLYDICREYCNNTILVQTSKDLKPVDFKSVRSVGITAGASTPKHIIEEVQNYVRSEF